MAYRSNYNNTFSSASSAGGGLQFLNSPFGDTTLTKVFVGGLAWETKSETLHRHFERFGEILEAVVITDKNTGRSKGYGFVTFRDPEASRRACFDQNPVIDGRRANCNLASLGRPQPIPFYGRPRPGYPYFASAQGPQGGYMGSPMYPLPVSYNNQQGFAYHPYGYAAYGSDYVYPQGVYNPYVGQQYLQMYGSPETAPTAMHPYGQVRQSIPGNPGYTAAHAYAIPSHQIVQFGGPSINEVTTATNPTIQAPYPTVLAAPVPSQTQIVVPAHSHKPTHGSSSDQTARS